jgi:hypothetical protein
MTLAPELMIPLGAELASGDRVEFPISAFHRGGYFTGQSGQGKSSTVCRILVEVVRRGSPAIVIDDAGETFQQLERFVAFYADELHGAMERVGLPEHVRHRILREKVLRRFTFGFLGHGRPNAVGIDILKRRRLPGRLESVEEVVIAALKPFEARFADIAIRTRFLAVVEPLLTILVAAERPITESHALLLDPRYWGFVLREIDRCKTLDDPQSRTFVEPRKRELRRILDLRFNKQGDENEPYPQRFNDRVESTLNALHMYRPGTVTGQFFDSDSFAPEEVVFHNGVFAVTSDISDELIRNQAISTVYTFFERLMKYRVPRMGLDKFRLYLVLDEIRWFYEALTRFFAVARNHRVSTFVLNQQDEQWDQLGMPAIAKTLPGLLRFRVQYRAQSNVAADDMAMRGHRYDPFGMQHRETTISHAAGKTSSSGETESSSDMDSESSGENHGSGGNRSSSHGSNAGWYTGADHASRGYSGGTNVGGSHSDSWSDGFSTTHGSSTTCGATYTSSESESETDTLVEHILTASIADQHFMRMQEMRELPEHTALVSHEQTSRLVRMLRFNGFPEVRNGRHIYDDYQQAALKDLARRRTPREPYDTSIRVVRPKPAVVNDDPIRPGKRAPDSGPPKGGATPKKK